MNLNEFTSIDGAQQSGDAFAADAGTLDAKPKPKPKRAKKTIDQQIAEAEEHLKKLKRKQRNEERAARTHRLVETGAVVEAALGVEFTEKVDRERLAAVLREPHKYDGGGTWTWADAIADAYNKRTTEEQAR